MLLTLPTKDKFHLEIWSVNVLTCRGQLSLQVSCRCMGFSQAEVLLQPWRRGTSHCWMRGSFRVYCVVFSFVKCRKLFQQFHLSRLASRKDFANTLRGFSLFLPNSQQQHLIEINFYLDGWFSWGSFPVPPQEALLLDPGIPHGVTDLYTTGPSPDKRT